MTTKTAVSDLTQDMHAMELKRTLDMYRELRCTGKDNRHTLTYVLRKANYSKPGTEEYIQELWMTVQFLYKDYKTVEVSTANSKDELYEYHHGGSPSERKRPYPLSAAKLMQN